MGSPVFFSLGAGLQAGSFRPALALLEANISELTQDALRTPDKLKSLSLPVDEQHRVLHEAFAFHHESRHLMDCYGTIAGLSLVSATFSTMEQFARVSRAMRATGMSWTLPPPRGKEAEALPAEMRAAHLATKAMHKGAAIFHAAFEPVQVQGHINDVCVEVPIEQGPYKADAFPLRLVAVGSKGTVAPYSVLHPLGLEAFLEGAAQAVARDFASVFDESVQSTMVPRVFDPSANNAVLPYNITDLMISRYLQSKGIERFPRDLVLGLTDAVLSRGSMVLHELGPGQIAVEATQLGSVLVDRLENTTVEEFKAGQLKDRSLETEVYSGFLKQLEKGGAWDTVSDDRSAEASIRIWQSYVARELTIPLLRVRLDTDHTAFRSVSGTTDLIREKISMAPVFVVNGQIRFDEKMPERVQQAWWHVLIIDDLMRQVSAGQDFLACPRAFNALPGLAKVNLAAPAGECSKHRRAGCGSWSKDRPGFLPKCLFSSGLEHLAFVDPL